MTDLELYCRDNRMGLMIVPDTLYQTEFQRLMNFNLADVPLCFFYFIAVDVPMFSGKWTVVGPKLSSINEWSATPDRNQSQ